MTSQPSKTDIEAVFQRLRAIPANKTCFDCSAKNPTWASITYGVFICIDCSAVHRGLGVHLTFVRSTQLDTNWTWIQLRQMQVGGNSNALQFFTQHNCVTTDAQKKYNSRAAQLYRDKVQQLAFKAIQNNAELHIHPNMELKEEEKEVDFFAEQNNFTSSNLNSFEETKAQHRKEDADILQKEGPKVDFTMNLSNTEHKSTIGARKVQPKKLGLGAKKGGLGATKVKTNFAELEREAALAEESRVRIQEETAKAAALSAQEQEERDAAVRLAYRDLGADQQKREEQLKKIDPRKAEQMERLGMGFQTKSGVSHSVLSDMQTIEQENLHTTSTSLSSLGKLRLVDTDAFFDDFSYGSGFSMNRNSNSGFDLGKDSFYSDTSSSKDSWVVVDDPPVEMSKSRNRPVERTPTRSSDVDNTDVAQKKFGSAKAISSDQFFTDRNNDYEHQANLSRFQGSSSISSSEYFGNGKDVSSSGSKFQAPDLEDVRESVRQGVTKVAGKISSLANGVMSSIQERYGY